MTYCTVQDIYDATKLTSSEVTSETCKAAIKAAEVFLDRATFTTYWNVEKSGTADSGANTTLTNTGAFKDRDFTTHVHYLWIYSGIGSGQVRIISSHTDDIITVDRVWDTNPDNTSLYRVIYTASPCYYNSGDEIPLDGNAVSAFLLPEYPIRVVEQLSIDSTSVTVSSIFKYPNEGKIALSKTSEVSTFKNTEPQQIDIDWWWGVYPFDELAKRFCIVDASLKALAAQIGGTHNIPSTYSLPEGSVTIGQAYVNIREAWTALSKEHKMLKPNLIRYPKFG